MGSLVADGHRDREEISLGFTLEITHIHHQNMGIEIIIAHRKRIGDIDAFDLPGFPPEPPALIDIIQQDIADLPHGIG